MQITGVQTSPVNMENRQQIDIRPGDTVRVWQKVQEKDKTRLQPFEGLVLARKHGNEAGGTFTVRRTSDPYGTEKIFPLYSPMIDKIEIVKRSSVRRAKLYHIREKAAKEIKRQMRNLRFVDIATASDMEEKSKMEVGEEESTEIVEAEGSAPDTQEDTKQEEETEDKSDEKKEEVKEGEELQDEQKEKEGS